MIYLNHAGTSWPKPPVAQRAVAQTFETVPLTWSGDLEAMHGEICRAFGVTDPTRLLLTPGATSALSVAVMDHSWQSGDLVLISGFEHHALHRPIQQLAALGVETVVIPPSNDGPLCLETLETNLRLGKVRMVAVTAASNVTGELLPVEEVASLARKYGALSLIDAAQTAGWISIDAARWGVDLFAFTGHKGLQGPWGIGALHVSPQVSMASPRAVCELPENRRDHSPCAPMPGFCDVGSVNRAALAGMVAGLRWLEAPERADRLARARRQAARLASAVTAFDEALLHGSQDPEARLPTLAFTFRCRSPQEVAVALEARGVVAAAGLQCAPLAHETLGTSPEGVLRLSVGPTNSDDEIDHAIEILGDILGA